MNNFEALEQLLQSPKKIVITSHANPDGDAIGSSLGLGLYLKRKGHTVHIIMPTEMPDFLDWMAGYEHILIYERQMEQCQKLVDEAQILFALDYNSFSRVEQMETCMQKAKGFKVLIDHHMYPDIQVDATLWRTSASSTCELVYDYISLCGDLNNTPLEALQAIFVGLLTDTGRFQHATSPQLFRIVADIMERGVDTNAISDLVFNSYSIKRFQLLGHSITESLELLDDINTGIVVITLEDHKKYNIQRGDLEGIVNFILRIRSIRCAILVTERKDRIKLSFRSKGDFSVQEICSKYFNGGGHRNASGGQTKVGLEETMKLLKSVLYEEYKETLTQ